MYDDADFSAPDERALLSVRVAILFMLSCYRTRVTADFYFYFCYFWILRGPPSPPLRTFFICFLFDRIRGWCVEEEGLRVRMAALFFRYNDLIAVILPWMGGVRVCVLFACNEGMALAVTPSA